jgi:hypothetical protein
MLDLRGECKILYDEKLKQALLQVGGTPEPEVSEPEKPEEPEIREMDDLSQKLIQLMR